MNNLFLLRTCQTQKDFAKVLGYSEKEFTFILFSQSIQNKYQSFDIPKKNGNKRKILAPTPDLKILQTRLSTLLTNCYEELEKKRLSKSSYVQCISSHGFRKKLLLDIPFTKKSRTPFEKKVIKFGIYSNASKHVGKNLILNIDLKDFFSKYYFFKNYWFFYKK